MTYHVVHVTPIIPPFSTPKSVALGSATSAILAMRVGGKLVLRVHEFGLYCVIISRMLPVPSYVLLKYGASDAQRSFNRYWEK
jgi:hypothetical protein